MRPANAILVVIATGFGPRSLAQQQPIHDSSVAYERAWGNMTNEESTHVKLVTFQRALAGPAEPSALERLNRQLDAQLKIEDLIIKSREAQYAKYSPLSSIFGQLGSLLAPLISAVVGGFITALFGPRMGRSARDRAR